MRLFRTLVVSAFALVSASTAVMAETIRVIGTPSGKPFTFLNVQTNTLQGAMVDLISAIAELEGLKPQFDVVAWPSIIPALTSRRADVGIAAAVITEARAKVIGFSEPLFPYGEGMVLAASDPHNISTLKELEGKTVGTQAGTTYVTYLQNSGVKMEIKVYEGIPEIVHDLALGRIAAGIASYPVFAMRLAEGDKRFRLSAGYKSGDVGQVAFMVAKDRPELTARLNAGIKKLRESGKMQEILAKWHVDKTVSQ